MSRVPDLQSVAPENNSRAFELAMAFAAGGSRPPLRRIIPPGNEAEEGIRMGEDALGAGPGVARLFDLNALKAFAPEARVRKMLFKTDQLWSEIACYEAGQSTVMHRHPREEEAIFVLEGTATMSIGGEELTVRAGSIVQFPADVLHDVRNPGPERCVIMFVKVNPKLLKGDRHG